MNVRNSANISSDAYNNLVKCLIEEESLTELNVSELIKSEQMRCTDIGVGIGE